MISHRFSRNTTLSFAALALAALALSGCGSNILSTSSSDITPARINGVGGTVYGGALPISGAHVTLWETDLASTGYPSASNENATAVQTVTTGSNGSFQFSAFTCGTPTATNATGTPVAGPFLYLTSTGGNTGAGVNSNTYLINALGPCSYLESGSVNPSLKASINEATTVAAAIALGRFIYVDTTKAAVYINAPANNNAVTGSCSGTGSSMVCASAGLSHAFANAYNLVDGINFAGVSPSGGGRTSIVANPMTGTPANATAVVPQAEISALANIIQSCVNSTGGSGTGGSGGGSDGTACGSLFSLAATASGTVPTDTIDAAINIVQNPTRSVGSLFSLIPPTPEFTPTLSAAPHDWSVGIFYPGTIANFSQPQSVALDANDDAYVPAILAASSNPVNGSVTAFSYNGTQLWTTGSNSTICGVVSDATDTAGNVWVTNSTSTSFCSTGNSAGAGGIYGFSQASSGSAVTPTFTFNNASTENVQGAAWAIATDRFNNLWYGRKSSSCNTSAGSGANVNPVCVAEIPYNSGSYGAAINLQTFVSGTGIQGTPLTNDISIVVDSKQNIWVAAFETGSDTPIGVIPNTGTLASPTYAGGSTAAALTVQSFGLLAIDSTGNAWSGSPSSIYHYSLSGTTVGAQTAAILGSGSISNSKPQGGEFDGSGNLFFTNESSSGQVWFFSPANGAAGLTAAVTAGDLVPCYLPSTSTTTCTVGSGFPRSLQVDSAGALWVAAPNNSIGSSSATAVGSLVQMLGIAAPTWPQLSYAKFSVEPQ